MSEETYQDDRIDNLFDKLMRGETPTDNLKNYIDCTWERNEYFHYKCLVYFNTSPQFLGISIKKIYLDTIDILIDNGLNLSYSCKLYKLSCLPHWDKTDAVSGEDIRLFMDNILIGSKVDVIKYLITKGGILNNSFVSRLILGTINHDQEKINWLISETPADEIKNSCFNNFLMDTTMYIQTIIIKNPILKCKREEIYKYFVEKIICDTHGWIKYYYTHVVLLAGEDLLADRNEKIISNINMDLIKPLMVNILTKTYCLPIPLEARIVARKNCSIVGLFFTRGEMSSMFNDR